MADKLENIVSLPAPKDANCIASTNTTNEILASLSQLSLMEGMPRTRLGSALAFVTITPGGAALGGGKYRGTFHPIDELNVDVTKDNGAGGELSARGTAGKCIIRNGAESGSAHELTDAITGGQPVPNDLPAMFWGYGKDGSVFLPVYQIIQLRLASCPA